VDATNWRARLAELLGSPAGARIDTTYVLCTTLAATTALLVTRALEIANPIWAVVSSIVVILPGVKSALASASLRVLANGIGAGIGVGIAALYLPMVASLALGLVAVAAACRALGLDAAARSGGVALVIVLLRPEHGALGSSETRVLHVALGCGVALAVTLVVTQVEHLARRARAARLARAPRTAPPSRSTR